ncbi:hypothetical protein EMIT0P12_60079 [Pseudomonas sp. IT-P12]
MRHCSLMQCFASFSRVLLFRCAGFVPRIAIHRAMAWLAQGYVHLSKERSLETLRLALVY